MIREAFDKDCCDATDASFAPRVMLVMAIATSIDALAVGITFSVQDVNLLLALVLIGVITFLCSAIGVKIGSIFGTRYRFVAELSGGILLILLGAKILIEGLFF
jgi:putative Mn2+ efflux pump MntP